MGLPDFDYFRVQNTSEAVDVLTTYPGEAKILAGGTDLLWQMKHRRVWGRPCPKYLVSMRDVESLRYVREEDGHISIGANTTHRDAEVSPLVKKELGALHDACSQVGSVQIRNVATIVGNVCNAAPSADTAGPLLAHGAVARIVGLKGERTVPLTEIFLGPGQLVLEPNEIVVGIDMPRPPDLSASAYFKLARRRAMDIAMIGVAAYVSCTPEKGYVKEARIACTTVGPTPVRAYEAERILVGVPINEDRLRKAADLAAEHASPRTSYRSTSEYRREMTRVFVLRSLKKALERVKSECS